MDKDTYGIKLTMDISDFEKGTKKVQKAIKDIEDETKVVIRNPYSTDFDFKDKFKDLGIDELERKLKDAEKELQSFFDKAYKTEYTDFTEKVTEVVPTGSQEQLDAYAEKLEEVMSLRDELGSRTPIAIVSPEEKKQIEFEALSIEELNSKLLALQLKLRELQKVDIIDEEQQQKVQKLIEQIEKYKARIIELGGKPTHIKEMSEGTEEVADNLDQIGGKGKNAGNNISSAMSKGVKSLKRFALSLFGIQSLWTALSRATHTYMNQNKELNRKIQAVWSGLGTLIGPVVDFLADLFLKLLGYINVVTKALFGFDFIAKANANTMKQYQKQISKTSKALSGLDEITNLNQHNEDDEGPNLIKTPELDEGLVKKLQELAKWLKKNKGLIEKVGIALGLVFGASVIAGWVSNIAGLIGSGAGLTGLLGIAAALILIYDAIKIKELYDDWKALKEYKEEQKKWAKELNKEWKKTIKQKNEEAKTWEKGSQEVAKYTANLRSSNDSVLNSIKNGTMHISQLKDAMEKVKLNVEAYKSLYEQNKLDEVQTQRYADAMAKLGLKMDGTKMSVFEYAKYMAILNSGTKDATEKATEYALSLSGVDINTKNATKETNWLKDAVNNAMSKFSGATASAGQYGNAVKDAGNKTDTAKSKIENLYSKLDELTRKKYGIDIQTKFGIDAERLKTMLNGLKNSGLARMFNLDKVIDNFMRSIPGFAIGTDLVKSDGLAYLHAGEKVVPANAVGGGYTGNDNETNGLLRELIEVVSNKDFTATITENEVGSASVNYIRKQNRMMGGSVI